MKVAGLGEALWDVFPEGKKMGGAPANFAYHASQFGIEGYAVSAIGEDALGEELMSEFDAAGLRYILEKVADPTGTVLVELDQAGVPSYNIKEGAAWDNIPFSDALRKLAGECDAVCFGSLAQRSPISRATINAFLDAMPKGSLKVCDINLRQHYYNEDILCASMKRSDILKINDEEIVIVAEMLGLDAGDMEGRARQLMDRFNLKMLILTMGAVGSYVFTPDLTSWLDTPKVQVASTVGAGDSFTGAFIAAILSGKDVRFAHRMAVDVSAYVCTQVGAMPVLPESLRAEII